MRNKDYLTVWEWADKQARKLKIDYGIEKMVDHFNGGVIFSAKMLPAPKNRFGWELRCEVVPGREETDGS